MDDIHPLPTIPFATRARSRRSLADFVELAVAGHPILIGSDADFVTLHHAFERTSHRDTHRLVRKRSQDGTSVVMALCRWDTAGVN